MIIGIVIVVAILASFITLQVTGNVIKVSSTKWGGTEVYTKAEVDSFTCAKAIKIMANSTKTISLMGFNVKVDALSTQNNFAVVSINGVTREITEGNSTKVDGMKISAMEITSSDVLLVVDECEAYV